jgi:hypothetical protein
MRLGLGQEAFEAAEDLQEGRNGGVMKGHADALLWGARVGGSKVLLEMGRNSGNYNRVSGSQ